MPKADFVVITALEEERDAILSKLPAYKKLAPTEDDVRVYFSSNLHVTFTDGSTGSYHVILMPLLDIGRVQAAAATSDAIRRWHPRYVVLVGIAGGVAEREIKLGDILVSDQIVDYELQKLTPEGPQVRWQVHRASPRLVGCARSFIGSSWQKLITTERPGDGVSKRHIGPIASGDKVIAFSEILTKYRDKWPTIIGVEMEAAGAAAAAFQASRSPGFFMIRGVSDLADKDKNSAKVESWRSYACDAASSYFIALLSSGPIPPSSTPPDIIIAKPIDDYTQINTRRLANIIIERFDKEELRTLCFHLGVNYDDLRAEGRAGKARELVLHLGHHQRISDLVKIGQELRPDISWPEHIPARGLDEKILIALYHRWIASLGNPEMTFGKLRKEINLSLTDEKDLHTKLYTLKNNGWIEYECLGSGAEGQVKLTPQGIEIAKGLSKS